MSPISDYRALGPLKFFGIIAAALAWIAFGVWLEGYANWPADCSRSSGTRDLIVLVRSLTCSFRLIGGSPVDYLLFVWIWSLPAGMVWLVIWGARHGRRRRRPPWL